ncbi:baseplate J/gp47 family protein [Yersinia enterocolitica]|uniref:baseplate J/gp47 family protein n=1 Tax=Yersinia enterocolitica TaxID=630 RepID=UPI000BF0ABB4|nr:baseplate J/gp47 family protein [Yersinia enterocolitica]PNK73293.1 phage baseplate protein [Yersinia enterocolitica]UYJ82508.1 baseplate J/gp47 family protein [Yersinia enterocolitica]HDL8331148.1 baseplate J/gp47 family protein [Yersinia enterocolitica]HDM8455470.1 baseplate J/gp47 family protein [Yersinia enterocolitica]
MATINRDGASGTTLSEYLDTMRQRYLAIDDGWNINPESPDGLAIAVWCEALANLDEAVINAYHAADPNSAIDQQLDRIAAFAGIKRKSATYSTATVNFSGIAFTPINAGTLIRNRATNTLWATDGDVITDVAGNATVNVTCTLAGAQGANSHNLTIIATSIGGITAVTNNAAASMGLDKETNNAFCIRRNESVALPGSNQIDNIYAALVNIDDVKRARIYENFEDQADENGVLGHSMAIFVDGGSIEDVINSIAINKSPGCGLNRYNTFPNKISLDTVTPKGNPITVTFFRPQLIPVYVRVEIASNSEFIDEEIKQAIVDYSITGFDQTNGFSKLGFKIGESIGAGRLFTPVNYLVAGNGFVNAITVGTAVEQVNESAVRIAFNQLGVFSTENIEVVYV